MKKYIYVCEYEENYAGGSRVFICTEKELHGYIPDKIKLITDANNCMKYELQRGNLFDGLKRDDSYCGIPKKPFISRIKSSNFTDEFKNLILQCVESHKYDSQGFIRLDWLTDFGIGEADHGLYIVSKIEVNSNEKSRLISDSYYSG